MKAGILVRIKPDEEIESWLTDKGVDHYTVGIVQETDPAPKMIWVQWFGNWDWDLEQIENLVVVSGP